MKKGKHSSSKATTKRSVELNSNDIYSSSGIDIYSSSSVLNKKQKKSGKVFDIILRVLLIFECVFLLGIAIYIGKMQLLPMKYIIILTVLIAFVCGMQTFMRFFRKNRVLLRCLSIFLTIISIGGSYYGASMLGVLDNGLQGMANDIFEVEPKAAKVTTEPFIIYLSGSDTRKVDNIPEKGLSDVNMIIAVDPVKRKLLMINTPRDYYVPLWGDENKLDKLTHAGSYGTECSMSTLESLYGIKFNYYVKINFKSVVELVDALGGVTVDSEIAFSSNYGLSRTRHYFKVGKNELTGDQALAFARERKSLAGGDRQRGKHQQMVISAIVDKAISPSILNVSKFEELLKAVTSNTKMNISVSEIKALFRMQLDDMRNWKIESFSVDGDGGSGYTYTYPNQSLWIMRPDQDTIDEAKLKINHFMNQVEPETETKTESESNKSLQS